MLFLKKYKTLCILSFIFFYGCATSYAPDNWLPDTDKIQTEAYGGWLTLHFKDQSTYRDYEIAPKGEFICCDTTNVYLLTTSGKLLTIKKDQVAEAVLELDEKNTGTYAAITVIGSLTTISHGLYSGITFPAWLIIGIPTASGESMRDRYETENPDKIYWNQIQIFARFPQGLPYGVNLNELKTKPGTYSDD